MFSTPIERYMSTPVHRIRAEDSLRACHERLERAGVSSLPVVDDRSRLTGVVSRSDLLRAGDWTDLSVGDVMTRGALAFARDAPLSVVCRQMVADGVHRVYVEEREQLLGVLSTLDVKAAIADARLEAPVSAFATRPVITVRVTESIAAATERLGAAHVTGLVVVEGDWPVGVFTQLEALRGRDLPPDTPLDDAMDPAMICMPTDTPMHRAAAQAARMRARRVIACERRRMVGILSGLDFARACC